MMKKHIRFDWAVKKILRDKKNFDILEGFLSELLKEDIKIADATFFKYFQPKATFFSKALYSLK
jgi:hypothetical protein